MTEPLPKWVMQRYAKLWKAFKSKKFEHEQAVKVLKEKDENMVSVILSHLRRHGWLEIKLHPSDTRKRVYKLKSPDEVVREL